MLIVKIIILLYPNDYLAVRAGQCCVGYIPVTPELHTILKGRRSKEQAGDEITCGLWRVVLLHFQSPLY